MKIFNWGKDIDLVDNVIKTDDYCVECGGLFKICMMKEIRVKYKIHGMTLSKADITVERYCQQHAPKFDSVDRYASGPKFYKETECDVNGKEIK